MLCEEVTAELHYRVVPRALAPFAAFLCPPTVHHAMPISGRSLGTKQRLLVQYDVSMCSWHVNHRPTAA